MAWTANFRRGIHSFGVERLGKQVSESINCAIHSSNHTYGVEYWHAAFERNIENLGESVEQIVKSVLQNSSLQINPYDIVFEEIILDKEVHVITVTLDAANSGYVYSPTIPTISVGDTVKFVVSAFYNPFKLVQYLDDQTEVTILNVGQFCQVDVCPAWTVDQQGTYRIYRNDPTLGQQLDTTIIVGDTANIQTKVTFEVKLSGDIIKSSIRATSGAHVVQPEDVDNFNELFKDNLKNLVDDATETGENPGAISEELNLGNLNFDTNSSATKEVSEPTVVFLYNSESESTSESVSHSASESDSRSASDVEIPDIVVSTGLKLQGLSIFVVDGSKREEKEAEILDLVFNMLAAQGLITSKDQVSDFEVSNGGVIVDPSTGATAPALDLKFNLKFDDRTIRQNIAKEVDRNSDQPPVVVDEELLTNYINTFTETVGKEVTAAANNLIDAATESSSDSSPSLLQTFVDNFKENFNLTLNIDNLNTLVDSPAVDDDLLLQFNSDSDSHSGSISDSESVSFSESTSMSESTSLSDSKSLSESASISESASTSTSASLSGSTSTSDSLSVSQSTSNSISDSESDSGSNSTSGSMSQSYSFPSESNSESNSGSFTFPNILTTLKITYDISSELNDEQLQTLKEQIILTLQSDGVIEDEKDLAEFDPVIIYDAQNNVIGVDLNMSVRVPNAKVKQTIAAEAQDSDSTASQLTNKYFANLYANIPNKNQFGNRELVFNLLQNNNNEGLTGEDLTSDSVQYLLGTASSEISRGVNVSLRHSGTQNIIASFNCFKVVYEFYPDSQTFTYDGFYRLTFAIKRRKRDVCL